MVEFAKMTAVIEKIGVVDLEIIKAELSKLPDFDMQLVLQTNLPDSTDHSFGAGGVDTLNGVGEDDFKYPLFDTPYINSLLIKYKLFRTRVMCMHEKTCYSYHHDFTPRVHIPVATNDHCFFVIDDIVHKLPADGTVYLVNTQRLHTFVNASWEDRIHIVGCMDPADAS